MTQRRSDEGQAMIMILVVAVAIFMMVSAAARAWYEVNKDNRDLAREVADRLKQVQLIGDQ
jgi:hypothetical protein